MCLKNRLEESCDLLVKAIKSKTETLKESEKIIKNVKSFKHTKKKEDFYFFRRYDGSFEAMIIKVGDKNADHIDFLAILNENSKKVPAVLVVDKESKKMIHKMIQNYFSISNILILFLSTSLRTMSKSVVEGKRK